MQEACDLRMDLIRILSWECGVQFVILIQILFKINKSIFQPTFKTR